MNVRKHLSIITVAAAACVWTCWAATVFAQTAGRGAVPTLQGRMTATPSGSSVPAAEASKPAMPYPAKPAHVILDEGFCRDLIVVKFRDGLHIRLRNGELTDLGTGALSEAPTQAVLARVGAGKWKPLHALPEDELDNLRRRAEQELHRPIADLNLYFFLSLAAGVDASAIIDAFNSLEIVELAQGTPIPAPPPLPPPDYVPFQGYLDAAPVGIGVESSGPQAGSLPAVIRLADLEYSWNSQHGDLPPITLLPAQAQVSDPFNDTNHGTAVLGEIFSLRNGWGVTGAADKVKGYFVPTRIRSDGGTVNVARAITTALGVLQAGDVILIEQQCRGPWYKDVTGESQFGLVPVEWFRPTYEAILTAVGNGVTVIEAAGNGEQDLDDPIYSQGNYGHWPFLPANDSGAIIVGAGAVSADFGGTDVDRSRLWFSNYGSTVDLQGWGEQVCTTGYGDLYAGDGVNYYYTATFGGTSSASPNVAAAAALLQSAYKKLTGTTLSPLEVKERLRQTGSPQQEGTYPATQNIGPRPNVAAAVVFTGACCYPGGACAVTIASECTGAWQGEGSMCTPDLCSPDTFINGDFESGNLNSWTITPTSNGQTMVQTVEMFDIDGPGPLPASKAAEFCVGQVEFQYGVLEGIDFTQTLNLTAGVQYEISFDFAAEHTDPYNTNGEGGVFSVIAGGAILATGALGEMPPGSQRYGNIIALYAPSTSGSYAVGTRIRRGAQPDPLLHQYVDNLVISGTPLPLGACCQPNGSCTMTAEIVCTPPGTWMGTSETCTSNACLQPGACCLPNGMCLSDLTENDCLAQSGLWKGAGTDCDRDPCPQPVRIWEQVVAPPLSERSGHATAYDAARGVLVLFGGGPEGYGYPLGDTWEWDGSTWRRVATSGPTPRRGHAMAYDAQRGTVVLFGGASGDPYMPTYLADTWEWDGNTWTPIADTGPEPRYGHAMVSDAARNRIVLFGGGRWSDYPPDNVYFGDTWEWSGTSWTLLSNTGPAERYGHAMAYDVARARVVLFGGGQWSDFPPDNLYFGDTWEWDGSTWTEQTPTSTPSGRRFSAMAYDPTRGRVVLFGGGRDDPYGGGEYYDDLWEWSGTNWSQPLTPNAPPARAKHTMAYDAGRGQLVLTGGTTGMTDFGDTWIWAGGAWSEAPLIAPSDRGYAAMAYDAARQRVVLFGGGNCVSDTWEWDGSQWTQAFPASSPVGRVEHAMASDAARGVVVMFGGDCGGCGRQDTWVWDGTNWTERNPVDSPPIRYGHAMAYDSARGVVVLFGGRFCAGYYNDTWEWDGDNWTQRFPATSPPIVHFHAMAYDADRGVVVLFAAGGLWGGDQTWEWDGNNWAQRMPPTSPPGRYANALAYSNTLQRVVLFGGMNSGGDTWEWDGTTWTRQFPSLGPGDLAFHAMAYDAARGKVVLFGAGTWVYYAGFVGACCMPGGTCLPGLTETACLSQGGAWKGAGTDCEPNPCP